MTTLLKSAIILDTASPYHKQRKDILITGGIIKKIADTIPSKNEYNIVAYPNLHVSCGWFDSSVSLGEPGFEERETIENGLLTAAKSGFTAVAVTSNTFPVIDTKSGVEFLINKSAQSNVNAFPVAALTRESKGKEMAELYDMKQSGAIAFGDYNRSVSNDNLLKVALLYAQNFNGLVLSFPKNDSISGEGIVHEGVNSTALGLKGAPALSEHLQIARDLFLLEYTGGKLHIPTISSAKSVQLIKEAKKKGLQVSCSVAAHHLCLTDEVLSDFDSNVKVNPPLRTKTDIKALIKGVQGGTIDMITSDHNPIDIENKKLEFSLAMDGTIGLESLFGAANTVLDTETVIEKLTHHPRTIFGLETFRIEEGAKADLTLFDPDKAYTFSEEHILSASKNSAFLGKELRGIVYGIYANNQLVVRS